MTKAAGTDACAGTGVHAKKDAGVGAAAGAFANITRRDLLALAGLGLLGGGVAGIAGCSAAGTGGEVTRAVSGVEPIADASGWDSAYYVPKYASFDEARLASEEVAREVEASGIVLLKNDGVLPLAADERVSLLGRGAAEPVLGGTGAALIDKTHAVDARSALGAHFLVNDLAFDWLCEQAPNYPRAVVGALDKPETVSHYLGEIPWSAYPSSVVQSLAGTVGVVVISRPSGEGADLSQDLLQSLESGVSDVFVPNDETANYVPGQHQLELCKEELELLAAVKAACSKMVVLLNVATSMEAGPLVEPGGACEADAILQIGFPGTVGLDAVADVPAGKGIEKSAAVLAAFAKTRELAPGESEALELRFAVRDLASWDVSRGAWALDAGDYRISLRSDSHTELASRDVRLNGATYDTDSATGNPVKNRFEDVTAYMEAYCTQLARGDFAGTFPEPAQDKTAASVGLALAEYDASEHVNPADEMPKTREKNGISLIDLRGRPMDDPLWELLLDQLHPNVMSIILNNHSYGSDSVPSVGKPRTFEGDGPAGISVYVSDKGHCGFPSEYLLAQTWDVDLARRMAEAIGQEMLLAGMSGWCAPAMNCHRSPFGGRNFEYFSEDPLLAGTLAAAEVEGAFSCGVYSQMKHFCLNDQDTNRCAHLLTWASEQAIREIYARPFEIVVKRARGSVPYLDDATGERKEYEVGAAKAVMSSYNYIGSTWAGGCEALCTGLLRDEWGYDGHVVSDWTLYDYTDKNQAFYAGTDVNFTTTAQTGEMSDSDSATAILAMRRAMYRYLYSVANSNAVNGEAPTVCVTYK